MAEMPGDGALQLSVLSQCRPMPTSNVRRKSAASRETVASCLCWDRRPACRPFVCTETSVGHDDVTAELSRDRRAAVSPPVECRQAELSPVDCRAVQPPACPY